MTSKIIKPNYQIIKAPCAEFDPEMDDGLEFDSSAPLINHRKPSFFRRFSIISLNSNQKRRFSIGNGLNSILASFFDKNLRQFSFFEKISRKESKINLILNSNFSSNKSLTTIKRPLSTLY